MVALFFVATFSAPSFLCAQDFGSMSFTIAPPLFQTNLQPGETWSSSIAVVNDNPYDVTLFAEPVLFKPSGESGSPVFINPNKEDGLSSGPDTSTLAGWITVPQEAFEVAREQTFTLPLTIHVPEDAAPGGHYAAVLIGNKPPENNAEGSTVNVTSSIASLIFLSVSGDVIEKGRIRDFVTEKTLYQHAEAHFSLRFENQGNVHLLPQGNIVIYNMFGKVRGTIPVNHHKDYGNVLPESIRKFDFTWKSDSGFWDIGRYKAEATIGYGKDMKQSALTTTYFYILPIVPFFEIVGGFLTFLFFIGWALRAYIRRALLLESQSIRSHTSSQSGALTNTSRHIKNQKLNIGTLVKPIQVGFVDLRHAHTSQKISGRGARGQVHRTAQKQDVFGLRSYLRKYRFFFIFVIIFGLGMFGVSVYLREVTISSRDYTVSEVRPDGSVVDLEQMRFE